MTKRTRPAAAKQPRTERGSEARVISVADEVKTSKAGMGKPQAPPKAGRSKGAGCSAKSPPGSPEAGSWFAHGTPEHGAWITAVVHHHKILPRDFLRCALRAAI